MAKRIMLLALCLMLLATAGANGEDSGVCLIVATDLHYLASELTDGGAFFSQSDREKRRKSHGIQRGADRRVCAAGDR